MTLILLLKIVLVGAAVLLAGLLIWAGWQLWIDHEAGKQEQEAARRIELESCLRHQPPHVSSFQDQSTKGFSQQGRRAS